MKVEARVYRSAWGSEKKLEEGSYPTNGDRIPVVTLESAEDAITLRGKSEDLATYLMSSPFAVRSGSELGATSSGCSTLYVHVSHECLNPSLKTLQKGAGQFGKSAVKKGFKGLFTGGEAIEDAAGTMLKGALRATALANGEAYFDPANQSLTVVISSQSQVCAVATNRRTASGMNLVNFPSTALTLNAGESLDAGDVRDVLRRVVTPQRARNQHTYNQLQDRDAEEDGRHFHAAPVNLATAPGKAKKAVKDAAKSAFQTGKEKWRSLNTRNGHVKLP
jgi:ribosomal protein L12E/L44/L45/RPP1/RPP2